MSFHDKLLAILNFGVTQVLPVAVKNPETQAKITPYIGLGIGLIAVIDALLSKPALPPAAAAGQTLATVVAVTEPAPAA